CEVVTRPLERGEREGVLGTVLGVAAQLGFRAPADGGVHVHLDGAPWRSTERLSKLILEYHAQRDALLAQLQPNPQSEAWRGPFSAELLLAAQQSSGLPYPIFRKWLLGCSPINRSDLNLLGVLVERPAQPTLAARLF